MNDYRESINRQYGGDGDLCGRLLDAISKAGAPIDELKPEDLLWFDQLHAGGADSTRELANMAGLSRGMVVLDAGSGVGGTSRILSMEYGCQVIGVDIAAEHVKAARMLTELVGLSAQVAFREGDVTQLDFEDNVFDVVWTQSAIMNIECTIGFLRETRRVLRPGGVLALEATLAGSRDETRFPVMWADNQSVSFMVTADSLRQMLCDEGFVEVAWRDTTRERIERIRMQAEGTGDAHPLRSVFQVIQPRLIEKIRNTAFGFEDGTYSAAFGVYRNYTESPEAADR